MMQNQKVGHENCLDGNKNATKNLAKKHQNLIELNESAH